MIVIRLELHEHQQELDITVHYLLQFNHHLLHLVVRKKVDRIQQIIKNLVQLLLKYHHNHLQEVVNCRNKYHQKTYHTKKMKDQHQGSQSVQLIRKHKAKKVLQQLQDQVLKLLEVVHQADQFKEQNRDTLEVLEEILLHRQLQQQQKSYLNR